MEPVTAEELERMARNVNAMVENARSAVTRSIARELLADAADGCFRIIEQQLRAGAAAIRDRDAGWAAADALALVLRNTGHILRVPAAEYVPAIGDAFTELDKGLVAYATARAKRGNADEGKQVVGVAYNPNPEGRT